MDCYYGKVAKHSARVANSTVEYSAFNRLVPGSNPGRPINETDILADSFRMKGWRDLYFITGAIDICIRQWNQEAISQWGVFVMLFWDYPKIGLVY